MSFRRRTALKKFLLTAISAVLALALSLFSFIALAYDASLRCPDQLVGLKSTIWKSLEIPVCWESMDPKFDRERQWVREAISTTWEKNSAIRFMGWGLCPRSSQGIRIAVGDINPHTKGLGNQLNGASQGMVLNFTFQQWTPACSAANKRESCIKGIAVHEFGHALGFSHEQNRRDSPDWCQAEKQGTSGDVHITPFDLRSVMNYCNPQWNGDGKLSSLDIQGLQAWYGSPNRPINRYDGRWTGVLTYSDPACVADKANLTVNGNSIVGEMTTPDGRRVRVNSSLDDSGQLKNFKLKLSDQDVINLIGTITDGMTRSTDCGCGSYYFKRAP